MRITVFIFPDLLAQLERRKWLSLLIRNAPNAQRVEVIKYNEFFIAFIGNLKVAFLLLKLQKDGHQK